MLLVDLVVAKALEGVLDFKLITTTKTGLNL